MATAQKFLFDLSFETPEPDSFVPEGAADMMEDAAAPESAEAEETPLPEAPSYSEAEVAEARQAAFAEGEAKGRGEALAGTEQQINLQLERIGASVAQLLESQDRFAAEQEKANLRLVSAMAETLFPVLARRHGLGEVEGIVADCLEKLRDEARLVIRTADGCLDQVRQATERLAAQQSFEGRLVFLTEPDLNANDIVVEWADGGASRKLSDHLAQIQKSFQPLMDAHESHAAHEAQEAPARPLAPAHAGTEPPLEAPLDAMDDEDLDENMVIGALEGDIPAPSPNLTEAPNPEDPDAQ